MNQITGKDADGKNFMMLVLEPGNLEKLRNGEPIRLRVEDMYPDGIPKQLHLDILFSETPVADSRKFAKMADVVLDERSARSKDKRPRCGACKSTIEQLGLQRNESPVVLIYCPVCGCVLGTMAATEQVRSFAPKSDSDTPAFPTP